MEGIRRNHMQSLACAEWFVCLFSFWPVDFYSKVPQFPSFMDEFKRERTSWVTSCGPGSSSPPSRHLFCILSGLNSAAAECSFAVLWSPQSCRQIFKKKHPLLFCPAPDSLVTLLPNSSWELLCISYSLQVGWLMVFYLHFYNSLEKSWVYGEFLWVMTQNNLCVSSYLVL